MKKLNKKGFFMAEAIIVSTIVIAALIIIYTQFISINNSYYRSFRYNTVNGLYAANNVKLYLEPYNFILTEKLTDNLYVDITSCDGEIFADNNYCRNLFDSLNIKTIIITKQNLEEFIANIDLPKHFSNNMVTFIKNINYKIYDDYRLIIEFNDDTFTTFILNINGN